jgi:hypothetical protein
MLSNDERRQLEQIEQWLAREDPQLAQKMARGWLTRHRWLVLTAGILGLGLFVLGCICASGTLAIWGFVMAAACLGLLYRYRTRSRRE